MVICSGLFVVQTIAACLLCETRVLSIPTLGELKADAVARAEALSCLSVKFRFDIDAKNTPSLFERSRSEVDLCDARIRWKHEFGKHDGSTFMRTVTFDGQVSHLIEHHRKQQSLHPEKLKEITVNGLGFFDLNMLVPAENDPVSPNDVSLAGMLGLPFVELRPSQETVNSRPCVVVDRRSPMNNTITATVWIDAERTGLPIRQHYYAPDHAEPVVAFDITEAVEINGVWVGVVGTKVARPSLPGAPAVLQSTLTVEKNNVGAWAIELQPVFSPEVFTPSVQTGFVFSNLATGEVTMPAKK